MKNYLHLYTIAGIIILLFLCCTFNTVDNESFTMSCIKDGTDTVSLWPQLLFVFSTKLKDSIITLQITPDPGPQYSTDLNEGKDTLVLKVTGILSGNTQYNITLEKSITAENGKILYPDDISFNIITKSKENEPNNFLSVADTLTDVCYGIISLVNDTDYFYVQNYKAKNLFLKCHDRISGFKIFDDSGSLITEQIGIQEYKSFTIINTISTPFYVCVFTLSDNGARYEIGIINQ